jgi:hypothetical protein
MQESVIQCGFIAEQQQPFTFRIEPADRIHAWRKPELRERPMTGAIRRELRENAVGFVEGEEHGQKVISDW